MRTHSTLKYLLCKMRVPPDWKKETINFHSGKPMNSDLDIYHKDSSLKKLPPAVRPKAHLLTSPPGGIAPTYQAETVLSHTR
jgi:hypothetical protein